jgi:hypothetical protein
MFFAMQTQSGQTQSGRRAEKRRNISEKNRKTSKNEKRRKRKTKKNLRGGDYNQRQARRRATEDCPTIREIALGSARAALRGSGLVLLAKAGLAAVGNLARSCSERANRRPGHTEKPRFSGANFDSRNSDVTVCNGFTGLAGRGVVTIVFPWVSFCAVYRSKLSTTV